MNLFFGWGGGIRTHEMQESKSCALPLGDAPILDYSKNAHSFYTMGESRFIWGGGWDSNPRSSEPQSDALGQLRYIHHIWQPKAALARREGLEPPALCLEGRCSIQLS